MGSDIEKAFAEFEQMGTAALQAQLDAGYPIMQGETLAREWLYMQRKLEESDRFIKGLQAARWTAYAAWATAAITLVLAAGDVPPS